MLSKLFTYLRLFWWAIEHATLCRCERCGRWTTLELHPLQTQYYLEHRQHYLYCHNCAEMDREYWGCMWDEYLRAQG